MEKLKSNYQKLNVNLKKKLTKMNSEHSVLDFQNINTIQSVSELQNFNLLSLMEKMSKTQTQNIKKRYPQNKELLEKLNKRSNVFLRQDIGDIISSFLYSSQQITLYILLVLYKLFICIKELLLTLDCIYHIVFDLKTRVDYPYHESSVYNFDGFHKSPVSEMFDSLLSKTVPIKELLFTIKNIVIFIENNNFIKIVSPKMTIENYWKLIQNSDNDKKIKRLEQLRQLSETNKVSIFHNSSNLVYNNIKYKSKKDGNKYLSMLLQRLLCICQMVVLILNFLEDDIIQSKMINEIPFLKKDTDGDYVFTTNDKNEPTLSVSLIQYGIEEMENECEYLSRQPNFENEL